MYMFVEYDLFIVLKFNWMFIQNQFVEMHTVIQKVKINTHWMYLTPWIKMRALVVPLGQRIESVVGSNLCQRTFSVSQRYLDHVVGPIAEVTIQFKIPTLLQKRGIHFKHVQCHMFYYIHVCYEVPKVCSNKWWKCFKKV